jgi:RNA polymerase sigma factor (sigma-70 family)
MDTSLTSASDAQLVAASLHGSKDAFGTLVERHQQAVCAVAYARTGSLAVSEDIAQETFLSAWKNLANLQAPERVRAWLCGTARNLASRFHRDEKLPAPLEEEIPDGGTPADAAIGREEEAMLWAALEKLPENHREPLILFYRSGQSVREIAEALELSEDAVKQRLSRGRVMLQEAVREKVESTLSRSRPGAAFTLAVLAALPALTTSAQAAGTGLVLAKGVGSGAAASLLPVVGGLAIGLVGAWFGIKSSLANAESDREREFLLGAARWTVGTIVTSMAVLAALVFWARPLQAHFPGLWIFLMAANVLSMVGCSVFFGIRNNREQQRIRAEERTRRGIPAEPGCAAFFEYRSRWTFLGLPFVHCRFGGPGLGVAKGWIAFGNIAVAPLFAFGGIAIGGLSFGGLGAGIITTAGLGLGLFSFSGLALGGIAVGGLAVGWIAIGGAAWGELAAMGGQTWAGLYGVGYNVSAPHANDAIAKAFFREHGITQAAGMLARYGIWFQFAFTLPVFLLMNWLRRKANADLRKS